MLVLALFINTKRKLGLSARYLARYLFLAPRPMPATPRRHLIEVARLLPASVVCHRYLAVAPRPVPAAPLVVHRRYLAVVPRPVPRSLSATTRRYRSRRKILGR
jgi:hypothetical protein